MTKAEVKKLRLGLYRVHWKGEGGTSLAAVGNDQKGNRWLAPCNWVGFKLTAISGAKSKPGIFGCIQTNWRDVERMELLRELGRV